MQKDPVHKKLLNELMLKHKACVLIPTYNNGSKLNAVLENLLNLTDYICLVNDGSSDETVTILSRFSDLTVLTHPTNMGKGKALKTGFNYLTEHGFEYAITMDSDGQHFAEDIAVFLKIMDENPNVMVVGARDLNARNMPGKNSFANRFSNFWYKVETGDVLPDTQTGFRAYPLRSVSRLKTFSTKYEFELELLVRLNWMGVKIVSVPIQVDYPADRISHFKPFRDFARISVLNTILVFFALLWFRPKKFFKSLSFSRVRQLLNDAFFDKSESTLKRALSIGTGIFFGIVPIWGYQLVSAIAIAYFFKLNKPLVIIFANISLPPMIPFILYGSIKTGEWINQVQTNFTLSGVSLESVKNNFYVYFTGALVLSVAAALVAVLLTFVVSYLVKLIRILN